MITGGGFFELGMQIRGQNMAREISEEELEKASGDVRVGELEVPSRIRRQSQIIQLSFGRRVSVDPFHFRPVSLHIIYGLPDEGRNGDTVVTPVVPHSHIQGNAEYWLDNYNMLLW